MKFFRWPKRRLMSRTSRTSNDDTTIPDRAHYAERYAVCEEEETIMLIASTETAIRRAAAFLGLFTFS